MFERDYFEQFGTDDGITDEDAIEVLHRVLAQFDAQLQFFKTRDGRSEYRYRSAQHHYSRECFFRLPQTKAEFEQMLR